MQEKSALITGAGKRIGLEILKHLISADWNIVLHYNESEGEALKIKEEFGEKISLWQHDFKQRFDPVNIPRFNLLINNAAIFENDNIANFTTQNMQNHFQINCITPLLLAQHLINTEKSGNIINMVDFTVAKSPKNFLSYSIAKSSLNYASKIIAKNYAPNFRCNAIALGYVMQNPMQSAGSFAELYSNTPMKKPTSTKNLLQTIDFLLKNDAITGETIFLDGGANLNE